MKSTVHVESTHMRVNFKPGLSNKSSQEVSKLICWSDLITISNSVFFKSIFHFAFPIELEEVLIDKKKKNLLQLICPSLLAIFLFVNFII
jgi:uncharacterized protein YqhQ